MFPRLVTSTTRRTHPGRAAGPAGRARSPGLAAAPAPRAGLSLPITWTLQMAQVSHSTSQLHMATAFHFLRENILSAPDLELAPPESEDETQSSSPSSAPAMAAAQNGDADVGGGAERYGGSGGPKRRPQQRLRADEAAPPGVGGADWLVRLGEAGPGDPGACCDSVVTASLSCRASPGQ